MRLRILAVLCVAAAAALAPGASTASAHGVVCVDQNLVPVLAPCAESAILKKYCETQVVTDDWVQNTVCSNTPVTVRVPGVSRYCIAIEGVDECFNPCDAVADAAATVPEDVRSRLPTLYCPK
jgi:hypothetical protein